MNDFTERVISEFRANGGNVTTGGFGDSLVLLHTKGAKSGAPRLAPVMGIAQPDGSWLVCASKAGAPDNPAWFANLLRHPDAAIETGSATVDVTAANLTGAERDVAWAQFTDRSPGFVAYQERAGDRTIPVVRLTPR
ncbi:nitroreductase family deazaflavin-dependent oxidoreductase [Herbiconiux daphne]|uniref:Nitroreductase family deazaflavin-dependent oxidoreductase n=1 Tax=Herbiconiux daphne TaxID=2970914 RepID=A0ABT2GXW3_9MICO|nr:nitroreductase family deazaflavin-dependent oxidoreductase [Herbiconiux daphne]MCS5732748.1 nitroreductase family deazaflavin-dependent oxidoreductase [Herbiconiux daphne]